MSFFTITILLCQGLLVLAGIYIVWSWLNQTPFYPSSPRNLKRLIDEKIIELPENTYFIDIGSGDGRIVYWASKYSKQADGIEFNPFLTILSKIRLFFGRRKNTKIYNKDFFKHDFSKYNVAYLYIFNEQIDKLRKKHYSEMPKKSIIVTNTFKFSGIEPDITNGRMYIYITK